jgi:hypothetical protein
MALIRRIDFERIILRRNKKQRDPEWIINNALRTMKERQTRNRESAVRAITQSNNLQNLVWHEINYSRECIKKAYVAKKAGNEGELQSFLALATASLEHVAEMKPKLRQTQAALTRIKKSIWEEETTFRRAAFRGLVLRVLIQACEHEAACESIMEGLRQDGYFDLPPEPDRVERSAGFLLPPEARNANPDPQTQKRRSRRRGRGKR